MRSHVKTCWGEEILRQASDAKDVDEGRKITGSYKRDGTLNAAFEKKKGAKSKVTYSLRQHTKTETRYAHIFFSYCFLNHFSALKLYVGFLKVCVLSVLSRTVASSA
jgi:hypothetical protein